jgi:hypothetical protein
MSVVYSSMGADPAEAAEAAAVAAGAEAAPPFKFCELTEESEEK